MSVGPFEALGSVCYLVCIGVFLSADVLLEG